MKLTSTARYVALGVTLSWGGFLLIALLFGAWFAVAYVSVFYLVYLARPELHQFIERVANGKAKKNDEAR